MKQWYVLAYDIREKRRSQRLHKELKKHAIPMQGSVYLIRKTPQNLDKLITMIQTKVHIQRDDVRLYPLKHPDELWVAGIQQQSLNGFYSGKAKQEAQATLHERVQCLLEDEIC